MILTQEGTAPTLDNFKIAEAGLLEQTGGKLAVWSGRAATAFYHAYKLAKRRRPDVKEPEIIMPAMSCTTAANVAAMMGIKPRFADNGQDGYTDIYRATPSLQSIQERCTDKTIAIVVIHLFGSVMHHLNKLKTWCKEQNILLIEDPTQALAPDHHIGYSIGSYGDVMVCSFNKTKIIDVGNGVLIANTDETASELEQTLAEEPTPFPNISDAERGQLAVNYRNMHHSLVSVLKANSQNAPIVSQTFLQKRAEFEALYLRPVISNIDINTAWQALPKSNQHRRVLSERYDELLAYYRDNLGTWNSFYTPRVTWRYTFYIDNSAQQVPLSEAVRKDGFHVSNLYWPVNQFFNPSDECPNADYLARRIINLWVDTTVDKAYVEGCCESLLHHAKELL